MIQDRDCGDENDARNPSFICENCGKPVSFVYWPSGDGSYGVHDGCEKAVVKMWTQNPRRLGVITGIT